MIKIKDKFISLISTFLIIIPTFFSCSNSNSVKEEEFGINSLKNLIAEKGISNHEYIMENGTKLLYTLSVPEIKHGEKVPLIIALHMAGRMKPHFAEQYLSYLAEPGLRDLGAIIFAPDALDKYWDIPVCENAILEFLDAAKRSWPIDDRKIIITGYSNGGIGTWYMVDRHPEIFSACIPMGSPPSINLSTEVPTFIIHGRKDELFNCKRVENAYNFLSENGANVRISIGENLSHYQADKYVPLLQEAAIWLQKEVWKTKK